MKIVVLSGSPKGELSVTLKYVEFIKMKFAEHEFEVIHVANKIRYFEKNEEAFRDVIGKVHGADAVLWAFPVYYYAVSSQYKRFIELIWERGVVDAFQGKYTAALSTSIHYYDHFSHYYMRAICDDLDMKYVGFYSAKMHELAKRESQQRICVFTEELIQSIREGIETVKANPPVLSFDYVYSGGGTNREKIDTDKRILVITDSECGSVGNMIKTFVSCFKNPVEVVHLDRIKLKGGCLGCFRCSQENICVYGDKDEFAEIFNDRINKSDVILFAGTIMDRHLSSRWKLFFDRCFFNNHQPAIIGKQFGFLISGPLAQLGHLRQSLQVFVESQQSNVVDIVTDECMDDERVRAMIEGLCSRLIHFAKQEYIRPATCLGVAAHKIFRDEMWESLWFLFKADHKFYKSSALYDFPNTGVVNSISKGIFNAFTSFPPIKKQLVSNMRRLPLKPLEHLFREKERR